VDRWLIGAVVLMATVNHAGVFELHIQPGNELTPARVQVALQHPAFDTNGRVLVTPEATSLEEIESQIKALQDDLDRLSDRARRVFNSEQGPSALS
jgi:hypothetical protein